MQELEESKAQLAALRQRAQLRGSPGKENGAAGPRPTLPSASDSEGFAAPAGLPAGQGQLALQQQLAEARHCAAQLQIELDAAQAKLAIYRQVFALFPRSASRSTQCIFVLELYRRLPFCRVYSCISAPILLAARAKVGALCPPHRLAAGIMAKPSGGGALSQPWSCFTNHEPGLPCQNCRLVSISLQTSSLVTCCRAHPVDGHGPLASSGASGGIKAVRPGRPSSPEQCRAERVGPKPGSVGAGEGERGTSPTGASRAKPTKALQLPEELRGAVGGSI